jgi:3-phenylpropionate/cinnamic acid dioxygenase small subunit
MADAAREIENLLYTYAERIDQGDLEGLADLFAHGRILASPDAGADRAIVGRDRVLALYRASTRIYADGTPRTKHVTTNAIVEVEDGGHAGAARSYYTVFQRVDDFPLQPIIAGRYRDTFRRIDGRWWFDTRIMMVDLVGDLSRHLLFELKS